MHGKQKCLIENEPYIVTFAESQYLASIALALGLFSCSRPLFDLMTRCIGLYFKKNHLIVSAGRDC